ncbi:MAG: hypothetical protein ACKVQU_30235 [Burkholderiales bacterium]
MRFGFGKVCAAIIVVSATVAVPSVQAEIGVTQLLGTWECQGPGQLHPMKPPILWFGASDTGVGIDGFAGTVYGHGDVTADANGSMHIALKAGQNLTVSSLAETGRQATMVLRRESGADYRCTRLPRLG